MQLKITKKLFEDIMGIEDCGRFNISDSCITYRYGHRCIGLDSFFFKYNGSRFFVGKMQYTNIHEVWWNTGNCASSGKNKLSLNSIIKI